MKHFLAFVFAALLGITAFTLKTTEAAVAGSVRDESGQPVAEAMVRVLRDSVSIATATTGKDGAFRLALLPGTYTVEATHPGHETQRVLGVRVSAGRDTEITLRLSTATGLDEVVVTNYREQLFRRDAPVADDARALYKEDRPTTYDDRALRAAPLSAKSAPTSKESTGEARKRRDTDRPLKLEMPAVAPAEAAGSPVETYEAETYEEVLSYKIIPASDAPPTRPDAPAGQPRPRAGLLTAGEWNDLHNWNNHWLDLLHDGEIDAHQKMYKFFPRHRYSVLLQTEQGLPISDVPVQLLDRWGTPVWEARTSNTGQAELWANLFEEKQTVGPLNLTAIVDGKPYPLGPAKPFAEGLNIHKIKRECRHAKTVDIVWTVDATGSMGDEIEYLKTELLDVIGRVQATRPDLDVRMGSVFYRDEGDEYLVKSSALNRDISKTVQYIRKQNADGGGDYPEAVHTALEETLRQPWSREAVARICFLVLDASPHQRPEVLASLQASIREAARRGIRIVPVSGSGIQKDTEFLMKFFGLATNGSYAFLTDHSGIGGKHLAPTTDEYKVEPLNDLLVRIIAEYVSVPDCDGKSSILFADRQDQQGNLLPALKPVLYYPNPATSKFNLELPFSAEKVTLYDAEGKAVHTISQAQAGLHHIPVQDLAPGFYTLRVWKDGQVQSGKVLVVRA